MATIVFSNQVADPAATLPTSLNLSLTSNGVDLQTLGSNAKSLLFNAVSPLAGSTTTCSVTANSVKTVFRVDNNYNGGVFALQLNDGTSYTFTLATATPNAQTLTFNDYDSVSPEKLRKWGQENGGF